MTYSGGASNVITLAHELGHATTLGDARLAGVTENLRDVIGRDGEHLWRDLGP